MNITLSPQRADSKSLALHVSAETLTVNGKRFDFSELVEGNLLPAAACDSELIAGNITCTDGKISIAIILPLPADAGEAARFPEPILGAEGKIKLPQEYPDAEDFVPSQGTIDWLQAKTAEQQTDAG
ncbi:MAG: hypothetical protein LBI76_09095, partial [Comamonas sp.]|nr:hypothetical protein [Comamonas sp.]